jgi:hypothetical protein
MTTLHDIRRIEAQHRAQKMSRDKKIRYLHNRGWKRLSTGGTQRWRHADGRTGTLAQCVVDQLVEELST